MLQFSFAPGAAATITTRSGDGIGSEAAASSIAVHQIALLLWLLCSFVCDALHVVAAASQALVADSIGREDAGKQFPYMMEFNILVHAVLAISCLL